MVKNLAIIFTQRRTDAHQNSLGSIVCFTESNNTKLTNGLVVWTVQQNCTREKNKHPAREKFSLNTEYLTT